MLKIRSELDKIFLTEDCEPSIHNYPQGGFYLDKQDEKLVWKNEKCLIKGLHNPVMLQASVKELMDSLIKLSKQFKRYKYLDFSRVTKPVNKQEIIFGNPILVGIHSVISSSDWNLSDNILNAKLTSKDIEKDTFICFDNYPEINGLMSFYNNKFSLSIFNIPYVIKNTKVKQPKSLDLIK